MAGRKVKCIDTGEYSTSDKAVKIGGHYYSSQEAYDNLQLENTLRIECCESIADYLGYGDKKLPTIAYKKLKELREDYDYDVILEAIHGERDSILWALNTKKFASEYSTMCYIFAILQNNIMKYLRKKLRFEKLEHQQQVQDNKEMFEEMQQSPVVQTKDLSRLVAI